MAKKFLMTYPDSMVEQLFVQAGYESVTSNPDFLVFPGGADVSPELYLERQHPFTTTSPVRDMRELGYFLHYYDLPKVGICRGFQFLSVCSGDKLVQHIEGHGRNHEVLFTDSEEFFFTSLRNRDGVYRVSSTHHQCVVPDNMWELFSHDGVCEGGVCHATNSFGVQWHPEYGTCSAEARTLFLDMVKEWVGE